MTKLEIIEETVVYYSEDPSRRATSGLTCDYFQKSTGNKCAVGRCLLNPEEVEKLSSSLEDDSNILTIAERGIITNDSFIERYRNHDLNFWEDLQILHDGEIYWDIKGLTRLGEERVQQLKSKYSK